MKQNLSNYYTDEEDEFSYYMFHKNEDTLNQYYLSPTMSPLPIHDFSDEIKKSQKNEYIKNIESTSTKNITPLTNNPLSEKEEKDFLQNDINNNFLLNSIVQLNESEHLSNKEKMNEKDDEKEKEIQSKNPIDAGNQKIKYPSFKIDLKESQKRIDYLIKKMKVLSSKKMTDYANFLLIPFNKKYLKLFKPSSKGYTSVTKGYKNRAWLEFKIKDIFIIGKELEEGSLQKNNVDTIKRIENLKEDENSLKIKGFLQMKLEDFYDQIFFDSNEFKNFCEDKKVIDWDKEFMKQKGYSLRKKSAFIQFVKNIN